MNDESPRTLHYAKSRTKKDTKTPLLYEGLFNTPNPSKPSPSHPQNSCSDGVFNFGKFKGYSISETPSDYLKWAARQEWLNKTSRELIIRELTLRESPPLESTYIPAWLNEECLNLIGGE